MLTGLWRVVQKQRFAWATALIFLLTALVVARWHWTSAPLYLLEIEVLDQSRHWIDHPVALPFRYFLHPPIPAIFYALWNYLGAEVAWIRLPSVVFAVAAAGLLFWSLRPKTYFCSALLITLVIVTSPAFREIYFRLLNYSAPLMMLTSVYVLVQSPDLSSRLLRLLVILSWLAGLIHYGCLFGIGPAWIFCLYQASRLPTSSKIFQSTINCATLALLPILLFMAWHYQVLNWEVTGYLSSKFLLINTPADALAILDRLPSLLRIRTHRVQGWIHFGLLCLAITVTIRRSLQRRDHQEVALIGCLGILPFLMGLIAGLLKIYPWTGDRHSFYQIPALAICLGAVGKNLSDSDFARRIKSRFSQNWQWIEPRLLATSIILIGLALPFSIHRHQESSNNSMRESKWSQQKFEESIARKHDKILDSSVYIRWSGLMAIAWHVDRRKHGWGALPSDLRNGPFAPLKNWPTAVFDEPLKNCAELAQFIEQYELQFPREDFTALLSFHLWQFPELPFMECGHRSSTHLWKLRQDYGGLVFEKTSLTQ